MAIDFTSDLGRVRLRIADLDEAAFLLTDEHLRGYLDLNDQNVLRASADALDAIATSEVLVSKKIRTQDLSTDGPAVAIELRKQATELRARAAAEDAAAVDGFDVIPFQPYGHLEGEEYRL
ncbi:hypothetical protein [Arthrobacter luteolus]|uniref:hypothetical protein n=1 Tax=Arthrobacter luteolus TaxID=98672 RepID=UPI00082A68F7|nr:hypothetical protein [Arthrobacter luteolus]